MKKPRLPANPCAKPWWVVPSSPRGRELLVLSRSVWGHIYKAWSRWHSHPTNRGPCGRRTYGYPCRAEFRAYLVTSFVERWDLWCRSFSPYGSSDYPDCITTPAQLERMCASERHRARFIFLEERAHRRTLRAQWRQAQILRRCGEASR